MFCSRCGEENTDDSRFCIKCGADLARQTPRGDQSAVTVEDVAAMGTAALDVSAAAGSGSGTSGGIVRIESLGPGSVLAGRYKIVKRLGAGGMGEVFQATDSELNDMIVAVKVLPPLLAANTRSVNRLRTEAAIALKLTHPNICRLHTFRVDGDIKFLVMEYMPGETLEEMLEASEPRRIELGKLLGIAEDVAKALDFAHNLDSPILHRDVKPSNIMVTPSGVAKVLDFGIARELKDSMTRITGKDTSGTLLYMSPEQFTGGSPTPASDIYSLAAMIYECLAGHAPFWQGSVSHQLLNQTPPLVAEIPDYANEALQAGLAKNASDRPSSAQELVRMLSGSPAVPTVLGATATAAAGGFTTDATEQDRTRATAAATQTTAAGRKGPTPAKLLILLVLALGVLAAVGFQQRWWPQ